MEKKTEGFPNFSAADIRKLAQSDAAQQLFQLLQANNPEQLQSAMDQAAGGDYAQLQKTVGALLSSAQAQELVKRLKE